MAHSGKPAVVVSSYLIMLTWSNFNFKFKVPVMGDQKRNAEMLLRHEVALPLQKEDLENADKLINTVREVINNDRYKEVKNWRKFII